MNFIPSLKVVILFDNYVKYCGLKTDTFVYYVTIKFIQMNNIKILSGFLAGATTGALLGILFAPQKGKCTRMKMTQHGDKIRSDLKRMITGFVDKAQS